MTASTHAPAESREIVRDLTALGGLLCVGAGCWGLWGPFTALLVVGGLLLAVVIGGYVLENFKP